MDNNIFSKNPGSTTSSSGFTSIDSGIESIDQQPGQRRQEEAKPEKSALPRRGSLSDEDADDERSQEIPVPMKRVRRPTYRRHKHYGLGGQE